MLDRATLPQERLFLGPFPFMPERLHLRAPQRSQSYEQLEEIGRGATAVVYRGRDLKLGREVALKILHPHLADRECARVRLLREARAVAQLQHPNVVELYDYLGAESGQELLISELVTGGTLRDRLQGKGIAHPAIAAKIGLDLASALECAHQAGIIHRDIKPENIMISESHQLKLADFGIAKCLDDQSLTLTGQLVGSPAYMAPEIIQGQEMDPRSDLFSLGVLLYQIATGALPFDAANPHALLSQIVQGEPHPASALNPRIDPGFERLLHRCIAQDPAARFQSAKELRSSLAEYLEELGLADGTQAWQDYCEQGSAALDALDEKIDHRLLAQAQQSLAQGQDAKALTLLSVIMESRRPCPPASELLRQIHRGQRRRRALGKASLALSALTLAVLGLQFGPRLPPAASSLTAASEVSSIQRWPPVHFIPPAHRKEIAPVRNGDAPPLLATEHNCQVRIEGLPIALRRHYVLEAQDGSARHSLPPDPHTPVSLSLSGSSRRWSLKSKRDPRRQAFDAQLLLRAQDCQGGSAAKRIIARARPAGLKIRALNFELDKLVLQCVSPCKGAAAGKQLARHFASLALPRGTLEQRVKFFFWAPGYQKKEKSFRMRPGLNELALELTPLGR